MKGTIAVDFDGVIHRYSRGWADGSIYDDPIPGVAGVLQSFLDAGYEVVVFTTRAHGRTINREFQRGQYDEVVAYLQQHKIPHTRVHRDVGKPLCKLLIDDNALRFEGNWADTYREAIRLLEKRSRPSVVCLCGSTRFKDAFIKAQKDETLQGKIVLSVGLFGHEEGLDMSGPVKKMLDELHFKKIDLADEVLFLNVGGYIGESTARELQYAKEQGKKIRFLEE